jgi:Domain of unknown function (DUF1996)
MRRMLLVLVLLAATVGLAPSPAQASSPGWVDICQYSHSLNDDPIVYPGQPGASHLHDFLANNTTNANSTYADMVAQSDPWNSTCPANTADTAAYWVPAFHENGTHVLPCQSQSSPRCTIYYRDDNVSLAYRQAHPPEPWPADFRMIAGNAAATSEAENPYLGRELYYGCSNNSTGKLKAPPNCSTGIISAHIGFPNCWNGVNFPVNTIDNSLRYPSSGVCPAGFEHLLPRLIIRLEIPVGPTTDSPSLACKPGAYPGCVVGNEGPVYTLHGDFWNTWQQAGLTALVARCLAAEVDCGNNPTP